MTEDEQALLNAAYHGNLTKVQDLLSRGVDINVVDPYDGTPLCIAASKGYTKVVQALLEKGAKSEIARKNGETPLFIAAWEDPGCTSVF